MYRTISGLKAQYQSLKLLIVHEFDEWKVLVYGPETAIHGMRQFTEAKAKEHALDLARGYLRDRKHVDAPDGAPEWAPTTEDDWLVWKP